MNSWNDTSDPRSAGRTASSGRGQDFFGRTCRGQQGFDRWAERTRNYLRSRTADHWLMFIGGLLIGALIG